MKEHEKVQIDNLQAHLVKISIEITEKNSELTDVLKQIDNADFALSIVLGDIETAKEQYAKTLEVIESIKLEHDELAKDRVTTQQLKEDTYKEISAAVVEHGKVEIAHQQKMGSYKDELTKLTADIDEKQNVTLPRLQREENDLRNSLIPMRTEYSVLSNEIETLKVETTKAQDDFVMAMERRKEQLAAADAIIEMKIREASQPKAILDEREKVISRRERDFNVIYNRFKVMWQKIYPNSELKI